MINIFLLIVYYTDKHTSLQQDKTRKRELRGLLTASKETSCDNLYLITDFHREDVTLENKTIHIIPAYEWLINK